jgi:hypothetical protein
MWTTPARNVDDANKRSNSNSVSGASALTSEELHLAKIFQLETDRLFLRLNAARIAIIDRVEKLTEEDHGYERAVLGKAGEALSELCRIYLREFRT